MFSFFRKKPAYNRLDDKIWTKKAAKYKGICDDLPVTFPTPEPFYFIVSFFKQTQQELQVIFNYKKIEYEVLDDSTGFEWLLVKPRKIYLIDAHLFENQQFLETTNKIFFTTIHFFFAEHHPKFSKEENIFNILAEQKQKAEVRFYGSIEDPLFEVFNGQSIKEMMYRLGMSDEECISSPMVTRAIENAQKKFDEKVSHEIKADSPEEWVRLNIR